MRKLFTILFLIASLSVLTFSQPQPPEAGKAQARGYSLQLQNRNGDCVLTYAGHHEGEINMGLPAPCEFVRDHKGLPKFHSYKNRLGKYTVLIVTGGPIDPSKSDAFMRDGCGTQIQAILLLRSGVSVSKVVGGNGTGPTVCPSYGLDEKVFEWLSLYK